MKREIDMLGCPVRIFAWMNLRTVPALDKARILFLALSITVVTAHAARAQIPPFQQSSELTAAGATRISGERVYEMLLGNTMYMLYLVKYAGQPRGSTGHNYYADSRRRLTIWYGKKERVWWMEGDAYCTEAVSEPANICSYFFTLEDRIYMCNRESLRCTFEVRFVPGNAERM